MREPEERIWRTCDHTADVIIEGKGKTIDKAFEAIALALQSVMIDLSTISAKRSISKSIEVNTSSYEEILFEFLSSLVFLKDTENFAFADIKVTLTINNNKAKVYYTLKGEKINPKKHAIFTDVKGVSYSELKVVNEKNYYICRCVVDV